MGSVEIGWGTLRPRLGKSVLRTQEASFTGDYPGSTPVETEPILADWHPTVN
jgi:hypothetical protein